MFLWKMPRNAREKTSHASPLQASVSFTPTKVSHMPKPTHSRRALQSYVARGVDILLLMSEELDSKFLSSSGFQDILLMVFCLPHWTFLLSFFGGYFSPQTFTIGFQGSFLCILLHLLVFPCSLHCRLMAVNTEEPTCPCPASLEHQIHVPSWMPTKHLQLSMSFFQWLENLSSDHSGQQPWSHQWVFSFTSLSDLQANPISSIFKIDPESYHFFPPSLPPLSEPSSSLTWTTKIAS